MEYGAAAISYYSHPSTGCYNKTERGVAYYQNVSNDPDQGYTEDGYFWLSYEDASLINETKEGKGSYAYVYDVSPASDNKYKYTYQYDGGIIHEYSATTKEQQATGYANIFKSQSAQKLDAVELAENQSFSVVLMKSEYSWENTYICTDRDYDRDYSAFKSINNTVAPLLQWLLLKETI